MASRVLGLVRDSLTAAVFGTSALASAFYTAFTLPNLFRRLLGEGALTAAFVPTLHDELAARREAGAFALVNQVASWLLLVTGFLVAFAMLAFSQVAWLQWMGEQSGAAPDTVERWLEASRLAVVLFPYLIFVCLAAAFSAALQTLHRFLEPALSPIWLNCAMIGALAGATWWGWASNPDGRMEWLCGGVLLGGFLQMAVPAAALMRLGWRPRWDLSLSPQVRAIGKLMAPTLFGTAIYLVNMAVSRVIGLSLDDASATILNLATRLMELPIGVFAVAVSTVVFPLIARYAAQQDWANLAQTYQKGMRLILVINIPAAVGLALLATPIIRLLFQRGAFSAEDTRLMMPVLAVYALGLPFLSFVNLNLRAFYAQKDTRTPVRAALLSFIVNVVLSLALMQSLSTVGLAIAGNVAVVVQAWYLQTRLTRKRPELVFGGLLPDLLKIGAAAVIMGLVVGGLAALLLDATHASLLRQAILLALVIAAGAACYGVMVWRLNVGGMDELQALVRKKLRRGKA